MLRPLAALLLLNFLACDVPPDDGDVTSMEIMEQALEAVPPPPPPTPLPDADGESYQYTNERVFECAGGGTVVIKVQWTFKEEPYNRRYYVTWDYDACKTRWYGTIDGKCNYSKNTEDKEDFWFAGVNYYADLDYSEAVTSECDSYQVMSRKTEEREWGLRLANHCKHPVRFWWTLWDVP